MLSSLTPQLKDNPIVYIYKGKCTLNSFSNAYFNLMIKELYINVFSFLLNK